MTASLRGGLTRRAAGVLYETGAMRLASWLAGYAGGRPVFPILTYQRVNNDNDPLLPAVPTTLFERHMAYVASAYRVMCLDEMVERAAKNSLPRNTLAITFDDGYRDNLTDAAPVLRRYGLPSTIFVATGF